MLQSNAATGTRRDDVHALLRLATRADHDAVDAAFGGFDLVSPRAYGHFLRAHARVLPAAERAVAPVALLPGWRARSGALAADLAALDLAMPEALPLALPEGGAARWGALYVVEGSRLGGAMLARQVPAGLPHGYLGAAHPPGGWRRLIAALDAADRGDGWRIEAVAGARAMFAAYAQAARVEERTQ